MRRFWRWLKKVFFPPAGSPPVRRILPYVIIIFIGTVFLLALQGGWAYTNTTQFCGTTCHTMPPEFVTHQLSSHARLTCEDCHLGRAPLGEQIVRKIQYSKQTGMATILNNYELPIRARNMRPARDVCETCHLPEQFSTDSLVELKHYASDEQNTLSYTYLIMKTGGGSKREGLGRGIHWHVENPVLFLGLDPENQYIPYVRVVNDDGTYDEYVDIKSGFDPASVDESMLQTMDCMTCHNRTAHGVEYPSDAVDSMISRGLIARTIPEIKQRSLAVLTASYPSQGAAMVAIESLADSYRQDYSDFYTENQVLIETAIFALKDYYNESVFRDQQFYWGAHPNNAQHRDSPGCFRCHDGNHLTSQGEAVRLECNLCHSVPVVSSSSDFVTNIEISRGIEPESHKNSNWIAMHRDFFDESCASCHTVEDPGGISNQSFCSNSGCHGTKWDFAGFDAPGLRVILSAELKKYVTPTSVATQPPTPEVPGEVNYAMIAGFFTKCTACHDQGGQKGIDLTSYAAIMAGGEDGPIVITGDTDNSPLVTVQTSTQPHFSNFTDAEFALILEWINDGAKE